MADILQTRNAWPLGTNFNAILIKIQQFSFKKMCLTIAKCGPFGRGLNVLTQPAEMISNKSDYNSLW